MKQIKKQIILALIIISTFILQACNATSQSDAEKSSEVATYGVAGQNLQQSDFNYGHSDLQQPWVTESLPDRSLYPLSFTAYSIDAVSVGEQLYFINKDSLYYTYKEGDNWKVENTGITNVSDIVATNQTVFCYIENGGIREVVLFDTVQKVIKKEINLVGEVSDGGNRYFEMNSAGNGKAYLNGRREGATESNQQKDDIQIISIDCSGELNVVANFAAGITVTPTYADEEYLVYTERNLTGTEYGVYVMNQQTGSVVQISNLKAINADERRAPFFRWNGKFVFMARDTGICIVNPDGSDLQIYKGSTENGFTMIGDKLYFSNHELYSFDLSTNQQQTYDYGEKSDFLGEISYLGQYIVLMRKEGSSSQYTIHMITLK